MKKLLLTLMLVLLVAPVATAQIDVPNTFISNTTILANKVNDNFTKLETDALNRTGGTMMGNLVFGVDNTYDIGASGATRPRDIFMSRKLWAASAELTGALTGVTGTFSGQLVGGGLTFLSGAITGLSDLTASGTVAAYTFSGSGASLTSIPESAIDDTGVITRAAANETVSGAWTFSHATTPITVSTGTSAFQAVTATTVNASGALSATTGGTIGGWTLGASTIVAGTGATAVGMSNGIGSTVRFWTGSNTLDSAPFRVTATGGLTAATGTFSSSVTVGTTVLPNGVGLTAADLGGDWREYVAGASYPSGATYDKLIPGSGVWYINAYALPGTYGIEAVCAVNTGTINITIGAFDLDGGAPDTALAGSEAGINAVTTGGRVRSDAITFPNAIRTIGVKVKANSGSVACRGVRVVRIS